MQVNLDSDMRAAILQAIERKRVDRRLFAPAAEAVLKLMDGDSFLRFKSSPKFRECLDHLNSPYAKVLRNLYLA